MSTILVTYADDAMTRSMQLCCDSARKHGVDVCWPQSPDTISREFKDFNREIFREGARGAGCYWLFKPYHIYKAILQCKEGDILIYADAGVEFVDNVRHIIDRMDENIFFFTNGFPQVEWCKMNVIEKITPYLKDFAKATFDNNEKVKDIKQVQASVIFFKVNAETIKFCKEWLMWCQMPGLIDDSPSTIPNYPTFADHRHDQAVLTCLQIKYGYKLHWWPTQYAEHIRIPGDTYPVLFNHHRKRNAGYGKGDAEWQ